MKVLLDFLTKLRQKCFRERRGEKEIEKGKKDSNMRDGRMDELTDRQTDRQIDKLTI